MRSPVLTALALAFLALGVAMFLHEGFGAIWAGVTSEGLAHRVESQGSGTIVIGANPPVPSRDAVASVATAAPSAAPAASPGAGSGSGAIVVQPADDVIEPIQPERFAKVQVLMRRLAPQVVTSGVVAWDVSRAVPVNCFTTGRAIDVRTRLGDDVQKDQVLLTLDSPDLADALSNYRAATSSVGLKQRALDRARRLYQIGVGALKDVEQAADDLRQVQVNLESARQHIRLMGASPDQKLPLIDIKAPAAGSIVEQNIQRGGLVKSLDASANLFTIADLSRVWVLGDLYENNLGDVAVGDPATVTLMAYPDRAIGARVAQISKVLDPSSRTAKVRLELANPDGILRPGMFATVTFTSGRPAIRAVIPATALIRLHDKCWVFRQETEKRFRRVEVDAGQLLPDQMQEIRKGLSEGDRVVVGGLQFATTAQEEQDQQ